MAAKDSGWTVDILKEHVEALFREKQIQYDRWLTEQDKRYQERFESQETRYQERFNSQERAINTAADNLKTRLDGMNEWRQTVNDLMNKSMPRTESQALHDATQDKIDLIIGRLDKGEGKTKGLDAGWGYLVGGIGLLLLLANFALNLKSVGG